MRGRVKYFSLFWVVLLIGFAPSAWATPSFTDGEDKDKCQQSKRDRKNCTLIRPIGLQDPETGEVSYVYKHWGSTFKPKRMKRIYKLQGLDTKNVKFQKKDTYLYFGLRSDKNKEVLRTAYSSLWPISTRYSFTRLADSRYQMVEHKTHALSDLPIGWKRIFQFRNSDDILNTWVKTVSKGGGIGTWRRVNPDLSLGLTIENVFFEDRGRWADTAGFAGLGERGLAVTKDPDTGEIGSVVFSMTTDEVLEEEGGRNFYVANGVEQSVGNRKLFKEVAMKTMDVKLPYLGGVQDRALYWPVDASNNLLPKPANILGMSPMNGGKGSVKRWLIARQTATGLEYLMGVGRYWHRADPIEVLERLNELDVFDDIYVFEDNNYAVVPKGQTGADPWRINYNVSKNFRHSISAPYPSGPAAEAGLKAAREGGERQRLAAYKRNREIYDRNTVELDRLLGGFQTTARVVECDMVMSYAKRVRSTDSTARKWLTARDLDSFRACRRIPIALFNDAYYANQPTGVSAPTLGEQLEEMSRAIANAPTTLKCTTNSSGIETCIWQ